MATHAVSTATHVKVFALNQLASRLAMEFIAESKEPVIIEQPNRAYQQTPWFLIRLYEVSGGIERKQAATFYRKLAQYINDNI